MLGYITGKYIKVGSTVDLLLRGVIQVYSNSASVPALAIVVVPEISIVVSTEKSSKSRYILVAYLHYGSNKSVPTVSAGAIVVTVVAT